MVGDVTDNTVTAASSTVGGSLCDTEATGQADCIGRGATDDIAAAGYTTAQLQAPTGYTGAYTNFNVDLDGDSYFDYPWNFGTSSDYPTLLSPAQRIAATPAPQDYDVDDNNLIEIHNLAQLNAMRLDLDGDGVVATSNRPGYATIFAGSSGTMGCAAACQGYELAASLTFPSETSSPYTPWTPIGGAREYAYRPAPDQFPQWTQVGTAPIRFIAIFDGRGHTLTNLRVEEDGYAGLFGRLASGFPADGGASRFGVIRNVGLVNPHVTTTGTGSNSAINPPMAGGLVGRLESGGRIETSYVQGGRIAGSSTSEIGLTRIEGHDGSFYFREDGLSGVHRVGGLTGWLDAGTIADSYAGAAVTTNRSRYASIGGLAGAIGSSRRGTTTNSFAYGRVTGQPGPTSTSSPLRTGGLTGSIDRRGTVANSYCDTEASGQPQCVGASASPVPGQTTRELQRPTGYTGIYAAWAPAEGDPSLWDFGGPTDYPALYYERQTPAGAFVRPAPAAPRAQPPPEAADDGSDYRPAADHPESYGNDRWGMAASCAVVRAADGAATGSVITFDLGDYEGTLLLSLSLWNGDYFASYESHDLDLPTLERDGQRATLRVATDPAQTRFLLDGRPNGLRQNLLLGYADCRTDDPGASGGGGGAGGGDAAAEPRVYRNDRHGITASCVVRRDGDGNPQSSRLNFDLGPYQGEVRLHLSLWNGEHYASYASQGLSRSGQTATAAVATNPGQTLFFLLSAADPPANLLLTGVADCSTGAADDG